MRKHVQSQILLVISILSTPPLSHAAQLGLPGRPLILNVNPPPPGLTQCNDGIDNNGDGKIDYPADLGCWGSADVTENFPDDSSTGPYSTGTVLRGQCATLCTGGLVDTASSITTSAAGTTIQCLNFTGGQSITVNKDNTTIRCVRAAGSGSQRIIVNGAAGTVIQDSQLNSGLSAGEGTIYLQQGANNTTVERTEITGWDDGIKVYSTISNVLIRDNWIHAAANIPQHNDAIEDDGGTTNMVVEGNHFSIANVQQATSAFMLDNYNTGSTNITLRRNQLDGDVDGAGHGSYTAYCDGQFQASPISPVAFIFNIIEKMQYGYYAINSPCAATVAGNRDLHTGALISGQGTLPECSDGIDNDGDGFIDYRVPNDSVVGDSGCSSGADTSELATSTTADCGLGSSGVLCGATNTGIAGKRLTVADLTVMSPGATTAAGQLIYRKRINGDLCIIHNNVIIRESQISGQIYVGRGNACSKSGDVNVTGTLIEDSTIDPGGALEGISVVASTNGIYRRNDISHAQNYMTIWTGTGDQILSNFGHDESSDVTNQHYDGVEAYCWKNGLTIRNNTFFQTIPSGATAPLNVTPTGCQPTGQLLVEYNLLRSANPAYVILIDNNQGGVVPDAVFNNNVLWRVPGGGHFYTGGGSNANYSGTGNTDYVSGAAVPVP